MTLRQFFGAFVSLPPPLGAREKLISVATAFVAILLLAFVSSWFVETPDLPILVGTMGASAVLLFAVPHSPMAQPWSFVGGHLVSAIVGLACVRWVPHTLVAAALAVALAMLAMHYLRCLHPPGGGTALGVVVASPQLQSLGFAYLAAPLGLNLGILLGLALAINNLIPGRRYPMAHHETGKKPAAEPIGWPLGKFSIVHEDLERALKEMNAFIDVTEDDLNEIYTKATMHAHRRRMGEIRCSDIMVREVIAAEFGDELERVWELMREHGVKGLPIIDRARRVIGMVTILDFLKLVGPCAPDHVFDRLCRVIRRTPGLTSEKPEVAGQIMSKPVITARDDAHIVTLVPLFSKHNIHHIPIVDAEDRLVGMVTQSDLMEALYSYRVSLEG